MKESFSSLKRDKILADLASGQYDVVVIGGGITGAGIVLDAQARGLSAALIEMQDFAGGTSSRSTKLIHGGLRYLKQFEFKLVAEVGKERAIVYQNGRHVTRPEKMLLPIVNHGSISGLTAYLGIGLYDFLANVKEKEQKKMLSAEAVKQYEPLLQNPEINGGVLYYEYRTDDARLTVEVLKKAVEIGAVALNYIKAIGFLHEGERVSGVKALDISGQVIEIKSKYVINAAGPWVDHIDRINNPTHKNKIIHTKGVHIVFDRHKIPLSQSVYFDVQDGRMVFAIPRAGKVYVGTTDTFYEGDLSHPTIDESDKNYLISAINFMFPQIQLSVSDIESGWAGLRPLIKEEGKAASSISRKDEIFQYDSGLISIAGGKLTGYRKMAEKVVNIIAQKVKQHDHKPVTPCITKNLKISGGHFDSEEDFISKIEEFTEAFTKRGLPLQNAKALALTYGTNVPELLSIYDDNVRLQKKSLLPTDLLLQLQYALYFESVTNLSDFLVRRTGIFYFNIQLVREQLENIAEEMGALLHWSAAQKSMEVERFKSEMLI